MVLTPIDGALNKELLFLNNEKTSPFLEKGAISLKQLLYIKSVGIGLEFYFTFDHVKVNDLSDRFDNALLAYSPAPVLAFMKLNRTISTQNPNCSYRYNLGK